MCRRTCVHTSLWLKASSASFHLIPFMHVHVVVWASSSSCPFPSSSSSSSTSSWFLPWCLTRIPWKIPCATPSSGAWSAWTMSHPTHDLHEWAQQRAVSRVSCLDVESWSSWLKSFMSPSFHLHAMSWCAVLFDLFIFPFYFDLSFTVFFHSSVLMHPDLHTDLDNLDSVENNLRHSAKGSLDAYDVSFSLTLSSNPNQLKTRRLESNLRLCGENWQISSKSSSLMEMTKLHLSSQRSTVAHMSTATKIEETEFENRFSNLLRLDADQLLPLLHLSCLFLVFLVRCCNVFSLEPVGLMRDGRSLASPFFRCLAGRGFLSFPGSMGPTACVLFDSRCCFAWITILLWGRFSGWTWAPMRSSILPSLFSSAASVQPIVTSTGNPASKGFRPHVFYDVPVQRCLEVGPMSLDWLVNLFVRFDSSRSSLPPDVPSGEQQLRAFPASKQSAGDRMLFKHNHRYYSVLQGGMNVASFVSEGEHQGPCWICFSWQRNREFKLKYLKRLVDNNNIVCLQEVHGKDEFLQAIQVLSPRFRLFCTFLPDNENAGESAICIQRTFCPKRLLWHIWLLIGAVIALWRFELGGTASFCQRPSRTWTCLAVVVWRVVSCSPALACLSLWCGRCFGWFQHLWSGRMTIQCLEPVIHRWRPGKDCYVQFFLSIRPWDCPIWLHKKRDATAFWCHTYSSLDWSFFIRLPMAEARYFHCSSHVVENLGKKTIPSDHAAVRLVIQKPTNRGHQSRRIPSWMSKHPLLVPFCSNFMTITGSLLTHFVHLLNLKVLRHKAKKMTKREPSRQTHDCIGTKLLITSTALRACRNRHLGTFMRCCEAWKPSEDCFDTLSFECIDFQRPIASLAHENLEAHEAEVSTLPWTQTEKDIALTRCRNGQRAWRNKKPVMSLSAVTDEEGHTPWRMKMTLVEDSVYTGEPFSKHARKARGFTNMKIFYDLFNTLLMTSVGLWIKLNLINSLHWRMTRF